MIDAAEARIDTQSTLVASGLGCDRDAAVINMALSVFAIVILQTAQAAPPAPHAGSTAPSVEAVATTMARAAQSFLSELPAELRAQATFPLDSAERLDWHYVPRARRGVPLRALGPSQRKAAMALVQSGLSARGYRKATTIMSLETVLRALEGNSIRDPDLYYVSIFGEPAPAGTWGWRVEGHHLSLNFTVVEGREVGDAPAFFGANPAQVRRGERRGLRVLAREEDLGRELVQSLDAAQQARVVIRTSAPADIITGAARTVQPFPEEGLPVADMTPHQRALLMDLVDEYARNLAPEVAAQELARLHAAGVERIRFAWAGAFERGRPHYYRIQGPTFLVEYDNTQNDANHIHSVWRTFDRDFGVDLLRRHYEQHHRRARGGS